MSFLRNVLLFYSSLLRTGETPLHFAARNGSASLVKLLLVKGADPTITSEEGTACDIAVKYNMKEVVDVIMKHETESKLVLILFDHFLGIIHNHLGREMWLL